MMNAEINKCRRLMTFRSGELIVTGTPPGVSLIFVETQSRTA